MTAHSKTVHVVVFYEDSSRTKTKGISVYNNAHAAIAQAYKYDALSNEETSSVEYYARSYEFYNFNTNTACTTVRKSSVRFHD